MLPVWKGPVLVKEYDIFVPLFYNDGRPVEAVKFQQLQEVLLDRFEGLRATETITFAIDLLD